LDFFNMCERSCLRPFAAVALIASGLLFVFVFATLVVVGADSPAIAACLYNTDPY